MKWLLGVTAALAVAVIGLGWQLKGAWKDAASSRNEALAALQAAGEQRQQAELLLHRMGQLDAALGRLADRTEVNDRKLDAALVQINEIQKTEGDSDESMACLDVLVPVQLDGILR